jgi:uncharacterized repeat protein (TIGR03803 family)
VFIQAPEFCSTGEFDMKSNSISQWCRTRLLAAYPIALCLLPCWAGLAPVHAQTLTTLVSFNGTNGAYPVEQLAKTKARWVLHSNGNYYGTTPLGGANNSGTVFQVTPGGALTVIYNFCSIGGNACTDGSGPQGALVVGSDGNLYGTTYFGGTNNAGTVFKITTGGALTTLYSFCSAAGCTDGSNPFGALVQDGSGNLWGATFTGGNANNAGTLFKITMGGSLTTVHTFCSKAGCSDGANPEGDLINAPGWDSTGNFYGATYAGGNSTSSGTVFVITQGGSLTTLYSFCSQSNCKDGSNPGVPLVQDSFGNLYGVTSENGANAGGTVFKISPWGFLHTLYHFCSKPNCGDGANPIGGPILGIDGTLYGATFGGGANGDGTLWQTSPWGVLTTLVSFNGTDGANPEAPLVQASNGLFYGTTAFGGADDEGTVFSLSTPTPPNGLGCNGVFYGTYIGNIIVSNGQSCEWTSGGSIIGNVYLTGGTLNLNNATVSGNVEIVGGTYTLGPSLTILSKLEIQSLPASSTQSTICGVDVNGDLLFEGNAAPVQIGSSAGDCPGNTIGGEIDAENNSALIQIFNNTIQNSLQGYGNSSFTGGENTAAQKINQFSTF